MQSGTFGDFGTFSFQTTKAITTGEGGMVTTKKSINFFNKMKLLRSHGVKKKRYFHVLPGGNFRLTNMQAAIGYSQIKRIKLIKKKRREIYFLYRDLLKNEKDIKFQKFKKNINPMFWTMAIKLNGKKKLRRDDIMKKLLKKNIETRNGFYSPNDLKIYNKFKSRELRISDEMSKTIICLPIFHNLIEKQVRYIVKNFIEIIR